MKKKKKITPGLKATPHTKPQSSLLPYIFFPYIYFAHGISIFTEGNLRTGARRVAVREALCRHKLECLTTTIKLPTKATQDKGREGRTSVPSPSRKRPTRRARGAAVPGFVFMYTEGRLPLPGLTSPVHTLRPYICLPVWLLPEFSYLLLSSVYLDSRLPSYGLHTDIFL